MKTAIIIPARYGSTRLPGKPLVRINGVSMLERVATIARRASADIPFCTVAVATDDQRIADHAASLGIAALMTPASCPTGSDRVLAAARQLPEKPDFIVNLQGDVPLTPPEILRPVLEAALQHPEWPVITPVTRLTWEQLDKFRAGKASNPFSGTTVVRDARARALWFSKTVLPAIRKEDRTAPCPVFRHIGLYGYRLDTLERFSGLPEGVYEQAEGLEQLRFLENDIGVYTVEVTPSHGFEMLSGVDSPDDVQKYEDWIAAHGDPHGSP